MCDEEEAIAEIKTAIKPVCGPQKSKILRAEKYADSVGCDIPVILAGLNKICGGIFFEKAALNVEISQESSDDVVESYRKAKTKPSPSPSPSSSPPSNAALAQKVGDTPLTTTADDLSNGVNELDAEIGALSSLGTTSKSSLVAAINEVAVDVGVLSSLTTSSKYNIVGAINELDGDIGALSSLGTTSKSSLVAAINEVDVDIGVLSSLTTSSKYNIIGAINELDGDIGALSSLGTTSKSSLVAAINEVDVDIGVLSSLTTSSKYNIVGAINELDGDIGALSSLGTTSKSSLVAAINEVDVDIGVLSSLTTSSKYNIVGAINEVDGEIGTLSSLTTSSQSNLVGAVNELDDEIGDLSLLSTSQKNNLVVAINEAALSGGSSVYVFVGTSGSFYSCSDLAGTSRTLIASGKNTVAEMAAEQQKCRIWARGEKLNQMSGSSIIIDGAGVHTYVSSSSTGSCYDVIGSLITQQTSAGRHHSGPESFVTNYRSIPSIKINCIDEECKTEQTSIGGDDNFHFLIPELTVSCSNGSCSVNAVAISYFQPLKIFSQIVDCDSFPCSVAGYSSVPVREIGALKIQLRQIHAFSIFYWR
jgi:hypothetical protein